MSRLPQRVYGRARITLRRTRQRGSWSGTRILGYHRICDAPDDELAVAPAQFRAQLTLAMERGGRPVRLTEAVRRRAEPLEERLLCVTLDDGYRDTLENAAPILDELKIPATVFLATGIVDGTTQFGWYDRPPPALSWDDVHDLQSGGLIDFGSHTRTHPILPLLGDAEAWAEIEGSRVDLSRRLGHPATTFSYPAGRWSERDVAYVGQAGYELAVTATPGVNAGEGAPLLLRRSMIGREVDQFRFTALMDGLLDDADPLPALLRRLGLLRH